MKAWLVPTWLQEFEKEAGYIVTETKQEEIKKRIREILDSPGYGYNWETADDTKSRINRIKTDSILFLLYSKQEG